MTWFRYGEVTAPANEDDVDPLLDTFMPAYEVVERHQIRVNAPAAITLEAARDQDLLRSRVVRSIFKARELILRGTPDQTARPRALLPQVLSLGWGILAEVPGREIVVGAVTKPWAADVIFRALPSASFVAFDEPDYVKIAWSLRADPVTSEHSIFRTETRAVATDSIARVKFRRYWSFASPGIALIRHMSLRPLKIDAERRARESRSQGNTAAHDQYVK